MAYRASPDYTIGELDRFVQNESEMKNLPEIPKGHPYYGSLVEFTLTDGWCYGEITEHLGSKRHESGDGYVVGPDGFYLGIVWSLTYPENERFIEIDSKDDNKLFLGTFEFRWWKSIESEKDLKENFLKMLPYIKQIKNKKDRMPLH